MKIKDFFNRTKRHTPVTHVKQWRQGMWVVTNKGEIGILVAIDSPAEVHLVNPDNGETIARYMCDLSELRQAKWLEIPECRRKISHEKGLELYYGS